VRTLVDYALERAVGILKVNRALLDRAATKLLEAETLNEPEIEELKREVIAVSELPALA
jgi:cell division protease FtsH